MEKSEIIAQLRATCDAEVQACQVEMQDLMNPANRLYQAANQEVIRLSIRTLQEKIDRIKQKYLQRIIDVTGDFSPIKSPK